MRVLHVCVCVCVRVCCVSVFVCVGGWDPLCLYCVFLSFSYIQRLHKFVQAVISQHTVVPLFLLHAQAMHCSITEEASEELLSAQRCTALQDEARGFNFTAGLSIWVIARQ